MPTDLKQRTIIYLSLKELNKVQRSVLNSKESKMSEMPQRDDKIATYPRNAVNQNPHSNGLVINSPSSNNNAIDVRSLAKTYGETRAVKDISFQVANGEIFAFLGPNGAGKTTTIRMLCTLARPTSGQAIVDGFDVARQPTAVRKRIGLVFQEPTLDQQLTAEENLRFHAVLYRVPRELVEERITQVLNLVDLEDRRKDLASTFSGGMARRLEIARGMLHTPAVLFLDEPTIGLDPQMRAMMWQDIIRLRSEAGITIFLTTHYMDEAEYADRIAIIDHGTIVALDTPNELKKMVGSDTVELTTTDNAQAGQNLKSTGYKVGVGSDNVTVYAENGEAQVTAIIESAAVPIRNVRVRRPDLDDVFMHFTGRQIRDTHAERSFPMHFRFGSRR